MKKDFSSIDTGRLAAGLAQATAEHGKQSEITPQEAAQRVEEMRTQGRKGVAAPRINMAFSGPNYNYVRVMAAIQGKTMTTFVNDVVAQHREAHADIYAKAKAIAEILKE